jgi:hypothetical protein
MEPGTLFFLRMRTPQDYRFGNGVQLSKKSWQLGTSVTDEKGCVVTFYSDSDFITMLSRLWRPTRTVVCKCRFENPQNGVLVHNDDFVVWGEI